MDLQHSEMKEEASSLLSQIRSATEGFERAKRDLEASMRSFSAAGTSRGAPMELSLPGRLTEDSSSLMAPSRLGEGRGSKSGTKSFNDLDTLRDYFVKARRSSRSEGSGNELEAPLTSRTPTALASPSALSTEQETEGKRRTESEDRDSDIPEDVRFHFLTLLGEGKYDEAFIQGLDREDPKIMRWLCDMVEQLELGIPTVVHRLSPTTTICLAQQVRTLCCACLEQFHHSILCSQLPHGFKGRSQEKMTSWLTSILSAGRLREPSVQRHLHILKDVSSSSLCRNSWWY